MWLAALEGEGHLGIGTEGERGVDDRLGARSFHDPVVGRLAMLGDVGVEAIAATHVAGGAGRFDEKRDVLHGSSQRLGVSDCRVYHGRVLRAHMPPKAFERDVQPYCPARAYRPMLEQSCSRRRAHWALLFVRNCAWDDMARAGQYGCGSYRNRYCTVPTPTLRKLRARATAGCMSITRPCA
mgnify:CR=1 FL=1